MFWVSMFPFLPGCNLNSTLTIYLKLAQGKWIHHNKSQQILQRAPKDIIWEENQILPCQWIGSWRKLTVSIVFYMHLLWKSLTVIVMIAVFCSEQLIIKLRTKPSHDLRGNALKQPDHIHLSASIISRAESSFFASAQRSAHQPLRLHKHLSPFSVYNSTHDSEDDTAHWKKKSRFCALFSDHIARRETCVKMCDWCVTK